MIRYGKEQFMPRDLTGAVMEITKRPYFPPIILFVLCMVFFPLRGVSPSPDSSWYLSNAIEIYKKGLCADIFTMRRPVFPFFMAISFHLFGPSVKSGFYIVRLFWTLNIFLCYFAGSRLYNRKTGAVLALLVLTSYTMNRWSSYLLLDNVIPFFLLLYMVFLYVAFEKSSHRYFFAAGVAIGTAMLVKGGMAIVFAPLPLCLFAYKKYRTKKNLAGIFILYLPLLILPAPWVYNILSGKAKLEVLLGPLGHLDYALAQNGLLLSSSDISSGRAFDVAAESFAHLSHFIHYYIFKSFALALLFVLGIIYTFYEALFRNTRSAGLLLFSLLLFSPIVFFVAKAGMRQGQVVILYIILYFMVANMLVNFPEVFANKRVLPFGSRMFTHDFLYRISIFLCVLAIVLQVFAGTGSKRNFFSLMINNKPGRFYAFSYWRGEFETGGWFNADVRKTAEWIKANIPAGTKMLCQWEYREAIRFLTRHNYSIEKILPFNFFDGYILYRAVKPLYVWYRNKKIKVQFEDDILRQINTSEADYIIITNRLNFYSLYFKDNPYFALVGSFGSGRIKIFKVVKKPVYNRDGFPTMFGRSLYKRLRNLYLGNSARYKKAKSMLTDILTNSDVDICEFFSLIEHDDFDGFNKKYAVVKSYKVY